MIATLIPFFLAVQIPVNNQSWEYGPEYVFEVKERNKFFPDVKQKIIDFDSDLICRPKTDETLSCHFHSVMAGNTNEKSKVHGVLPSFEVEFHANGIGRLITPTKWRYHALEWPKNILRLMSIGFDISDKTNGNYGELENSTSGECGIILNIQRRPSTDSEKYYDGNNNNNSKLISLPRLGKISDETIEINNEKDLTNCCYATMFFGTFGPERCNSSSSRGRSKLDSLTKANNLIVISDAHFSSRLQNEGVMTVDDKQVTVTETLTLELKNIRPATTEIPQLEDVASHDFMYPRKE